MSLPAHAQAVKLIFEGALVPGLDWNPATEGNFVKGSVKVYSDATVQVSIVGAQPETTYYVWFAGLSALDFNLAHVCGFSRQKRAKNRKNPHKH